MKPRPYTRDDVLYHRKCRGETHTSTFDHTLMKLTDHPLYCGSVGKVHEFRTMIQYSCKAGSWCVPKFDELEQTRPIETSTVRLTARRMCNAICGEPEPTSTFDGSGREWAFRSVDAGPDWTLQTAGDIAAEFGEVQMEFLTHESTPCKMKFSKNGCTFVGVGQKWPEAHAQLFHQIVLEKRRRELAKAGLR